MLPTPRTPPHQRSSLPLVSPITPPIRRPPKKNTGTQLATGGKETPAAGAMDIAHKGSGVMSSGKKKVLSAGGFAKMDLFGALGREELKPIRRVVAGRGRGARKGGDDSDDDSFFDSSEEEDFSIHPQPAEIPKDPNYNPDLSDPGMSRSPSPFQPCDPSYSLPVSTALHSHPDNIPSADPSLYFQKTIPTHHSIVVYKPGTYRTETMRAPVAYWKWPSEKEVAAAAQKEAERKAARARARGGADASTPEIPAFQQFEFEKLTLSNISIRVQKSPYPPHINWIQRSLDIITRAKEEEAKAEERKKELERMKKKHVEMMKANREEALKAVASGVVIDEEDGFIRVKGTRKRLCAGMDLDVGRVRRKYIWKQGKAPLRGKAKADHDARVAAEHAARLERHASRRAAGLPVTDIEADDLPLPVVSSAPRSKPKLAARKLGGARKKGDGYEEKNGNGEMTKNPVQKKRKVVSSSNSESIDSITNADVLAGADVISDGAGEADSESEESVQIMRKKNFTARATARKSRSVKEVTSKVVAGTPESDGDGGIKTPEPIRKESEPVATQNIVDSCDGGNLDGLKTMTGKLATARKTNKAVMKPSVRKTAVVNLAGNAALVTGQIPASGFESKSASTAVKKTADASNRISNKGKVADAAINNTPIPNISITTTEKSPDPAPSIALSKTTPISTSGDTHGEKQKSILKPNGVARKSCTSGASTKNTPIQTTNPTRTKNTAPQALLSGKEVEKKTPTPLLASTSSTTAKVPKRTSKVTPSTAKKPPSPNSATSKPVAMNMSNSISISGTARGRDEMGVLWAFTIQEKEKDKYQRRRLGG